MKVSIWRYRASIGELLACGPAIGAVAIVLLVLIRGWLGGEAIENRYRTEGRAAVAAEDWQLAAVNFRRVLNGPGEAQPVDLLTWVEILSHTGDVEAADTVLRRLAPDDHLGYRPAHRIMAVRLAARLGSESGDDEVALDQLRHHLTSWADDRSIEALKIWSQYYLRIGETDNAIAALERAATIDDSLRLTVMRLHLRLGHIRRYNRMVEDMTDRLERTIDGEPLDSSSRILLAKVYVLEDRLDDAEQILRDGLSLINTAQYAAGVAEFYVLRYDYSIAKAGSFEDQLRFLDEALQLAPSHRPIYFRLISMYQQVGNEDQRAHIRGVLERRIAGGKSLPLSHFALSSVLWLDGKLEDSMFHAQQAYRLDPSMIVVANNLAWLMLQHEGTDVDRAIAMAQQAVDLRPDVTEYRKTLAMAHMVAENNQTALEHYERLIANPEAADPELHRFVAILYERLGKESIAKIHRELAAAPH